MMADLSHLPWFPQLNLLKGRRCQIAARHPFIRIKAKEAKPVLRKLLPITLSCLSLLPMSACEAPAAGESKLTATPTPFTARRPANPYIAYLNEGNLWVVRADGSDLRQIAAAPPGEVIQDFLWSPDGQRCYFAVGKRFYDVAVMTGNLANGGELTVPEGISIDRLELGRDGKTMLIHVLDANAQPRIYGVTVGEREAHELSVDEYSALTSLTAPIVRQVGDLSVSPDAQYVLFKEAIGTGEELFVADIETGRRWQISNLAVLDGFEASAEEAGGRTLLEATWSPDGQHVIFNPSQSCSETGLCYGRLFLVDRRGGAQLQLSIDMMVSLPLEWNSSNTGLTYDDGNQIVLADTQGQTKRLSDGNRPKWQPVKE